MLLEEFNSCTREVAVDLVRTALDVPRWSDEIVDARPYASVAALLDAVASAARPLTVAEIDGALVHHPRIGERPTGDDASAALARREQAGVDASSADALAAGNRAYERRFDRVFLVRAAGRTADAILALLHARLANDLDEELAVIDQQLREIAALRLEGAIEHEDEEGARA